MYPHFTFCFYVIEKPNALIAVFSYFENDHPHKLSCKVFVPFFLVKKQVFFRYCRTPTR